jgi:hypothetical protein
MRDSATLIGAAFMAFSCGTPTLTVSSLATKTLDVQVDDTNDGSQFYPVHEGWLRLNNDQEGCYAFDPSIVATVNGVKLGGSTWPTQRPDGLTLRGCSQPSWLITPDAFDGSSTLNVSLTDATGEVSAVFPEGAELRDVQVASGDLQGGATGILAWTPAGDRLATGTASYTPDADAGLPWKVGVDAGSFMVPIGQAASTGTLKINVTAVTSATTCSGVAGCSASIDVERVFPTSYR